MTDKEKQVRGCIVILLEAVRKIVTTVPSKSASLVQFDQAVAVLINQLSDQGPEVC